MAIKPKKIIETAVELGRGAVTRAVELADRRPRDAETAKKPTTPASPAVNTTPRAVRKPSGAPSTVGAARPGEARGHKSATAPKTTKRPPAGATKAPKAKPAAKR
jgi:hypothetical protein